MTILFFSNSFKAANISQFNWRKIKKKKKSAKQELELFNRIKYPCDDADPFSTPDEKWKGERGKKKRTEK